MTYNNDYNHTSKQLWIFWIKEYYQQDPTDARHTQLIEEGNNRYSLECWTEE